jgi:hypothetical protein
MCKESISSIARELKLPLLIHGLGPKRRFEVGWIGQVTRNCRDCDSPDFHHI